MVVQISYIRGRILGTINSVIPLCCQTPKIKNLGISTNHNPKATWLKLATKTVIITNGTSRFWGFEVKLPGNPKVVSGSSLHTNHEPWFSSNNAPVHISIHVSFSIHPSWLTILTITDGQSLTITKHQPSLMNNQNDSEWPSSNPSWVCSSTGRLDVKWLLEGTCILRVLLPARWQGPVMMLSDGEWWSMMTFDWYWYNSVNDWGWCNL